MSRLNFSRLTAVAAAVLTLVLVLLAGAGTTVSPAVARAAATCSDYPNQAAAQAAADTRDPDGNGIYCQSLPCPCSTAGSASTKPGPTTPTTPAKCSKPSAVQNISFSKTKYPNIRAHFLAAVKKGWPQILAVNRPGASERRDRLLADIPTRMGDDRDEYPPAAGRGKYRKALEKGTDPTGWRADVAYVPSAENRSHGSVLGAKLKRFCNGTRYRYRFY